MESKEDALGVGLGRGACVCIAVECRLNEGGCLPFCQKFSVERTVQEALSADSCKNPPGKEEAVPSCISLHLSVPLHGS